MTGPLGNRIWDAIMQAGHMLGAVADKLEDARLMPPALAFSRASVALYRMASAWTAYRSRRLAAG